MTNNEAYWTERALKRAEEAYLHDAALTAKLFQEYESAAKAIKREISAFYSKYAGKYGLTYDQAVRLLNRKEFQEWKASLAEYVDYIATIQDPKVKALLTAQLDALSANSSISRLEALQGQIDLILNDLFDKGVAQMKNQFGDDFVEGFTRNVMTFNPGPDSSTRSQRSTMRPLKTSFLIPGPAPCFPIAYGRTNRRFFSTPGKF